MSLLTEINQSGQFPPVTLKIKPLDGSFPVINIQNFLSYQFEQSILIPADSFTFTFAAPDSMNTFQSYFREGDIALLYANDILIATGLIDQVDVEVDPEFGERITVSGRDLMGQLEDQDSVSMDSTMIFGGAPTSNGGPSQGMTVTQVFQTLVRNTRIQNLRPQNAPAAQYLFATQPGESKLSALIRYMEPLNIISWMDPDGTLVIGRPDMSQDSNGTLMVNKKNRQANAIGMKASFSSATIPNLIVPVWSTQTNVQSALNPEQAIKNLAAGPSRLLGLGHRLVKSVVVSNPNGDGPAQLSSRNAFAAGTGNILRAYAQREMARQNVKELLVQVIMPGHCDGDGDPFTMDTVYTIDFDRAFSVPINMYCYQVQYSLSLEKGQVTNMFFCNLGSIVGSIQFQ